MFQIISKLILKLPAPNGSPPSTIAQRISGLDHELRNDPMKDDAFEVTAPRMSDKVLHSFRCLLREQPEVHIS